MRFAIFILLLGLALFPACIHHNNHNTNITVHESGGSYQFSAYFPEDETGKIHRLINKRLSPSRLFSSTNDYLNITTTLQDHTQFAVKASPGIIEIKIYREGNSPAAYDRIKDMCGEINQTLKN